MTRSRDNSPFVPWIDRWEFFAGQALASIHPETWWDPVVTAKRAASVADELEKLAQERRSQ